MKNGNISRRKEEAQSEIENANKLREFYWQIPDRQKSKHWVEVIGMVPFVEEWDRGVDRKFGGISGDYDSIYNRGPEEENQSINDDDGGQMGVFNLS